VPSALMAPGGLRVFTRVGGGDCARLRLEAMATATALRGTSRRKIRPSVLSKVAADFLKSVRIDIKILSEPAQQRTVRGDSLIASR
jgi:hypothetical protein